MLTILVDFDIESQVPYSVILADLLKTLLKSIQWGLLLEKCFLNGIVKILKLKSITSSQDKTNVHQIYMATPDKQVRKTVSLARGKLFSSSQLEQSKSEQEKTVKNLYH